jgi:hypothetical protein
LGIAATIRIIGHEGWFWVLAIVLTSFASVLFKLILFIGKKVSLFSLLILSTAEILGIVLFFISITYRCLEGELFIVVISIYIGVIFGFYWIADNTPFRIFSSIFTSFVCNLLFFIVFFIRLVYEFHIHFQERCS